MGRISVIALCMGLAACGSRLNPFNWFGGEREERIEVVEPVTRADPRPLVDEVVSLLIEPLPGGAIIRTIGRPPTQGYWAADLVEVVQEDGALVYEFRAQPSPTPQAVGSVPSREVITGLYVSDEALRGVSTITVIGRQNRRSVTRR